MITITAGQGRPPSEARACPYGLYALLLLQEEENHFTPADTAQPDTVHDHQAPGRHEP